MALGTERFEKDSIARLCRGSIMLDHAGRRTRTPGLATASQYFSARNA